MPEVTYIAPVFQVADLARSLAFYRDQLGFEVAFIYEGSYAMSAAMVVTSTSIALRPRRVTRPRLSVRNA